MSFFKRNNGDRALISGAHPLNSQFPPISETLARAQQEVDREPPKPEPFMVPHVQDVVGKTLVRLRHDEHELELKLADVAERLRQTQVAIEALSAAENILLTDLRDMGIVEAIKRHEQQKAQEQTVEEAAEAAIAEFERELDGQDAPTTV